MTNARSGLLILGKCFRIKAFVGHDKINFLRPRKGRVSSHFSVLFVSVRSSRGLWNGKWFNQSLRSYWWGLVTIWSYLR